MDTRSRKPFVRHVVSRAVACTLALCLFPTLAYAEVTVEVEGEYKEGEVIVVYDEQSTFDDALELETEETASDKGFEVVEDLPTEDNAGETVLAEVPDDMSVEEAVATMENMDGVLYAQPNYVYTLEDEIEDQSLFEAMATITDPYYTSGSQINLTPHKLLQAWNLVQTNGKVAIAVIDSGCRLNHEDLTNVVDKNTAWDYSGSNNQLLSKNSNGGDAYGHGTHVCGIVGAEVNNNKGIAGASYNATIVPINVFTKIDGNWVTDTAILCRALNKVLDLHKSMPELKVVNMSLGGPGSNTALDNVISTLYDNGVLCVVAAGNENTTTAYMPADCSDALSVMALNQSGSHTSYTNYKTGSDISTGTTISAVGGDSSNKILSTYYSSNASYSYMSGTSMAAPTVSGVAALVWAVNPDLTPEQVMDILTSTATKVSSTNGYSGKDSASAGSVNAYAAVVAARQLTLTQVPVPTAATGLVYNGSEQAGIVEGEGYTVSNATATAAGKYKATVTLTDTSTYVWADGTNAAKTIEWSIAQAPLVATYAGGFIKAGETIPTTVEVTGFVNGEDASTAAGYKAPSVSTSSVNASTPGAYSLTPANGSATNYSFSYVAGSLIISGKVAVPTAITGLTYTGTKQAGIAANAGYKLSSAYEATDAGTYTATVEPADYYTWEDGTTDAKTIEWSIAPAALTATYDGGSIGRTAEAITSVSVTGFVKGESASSAVGYTAPTVDLSGVDTSKAGTYTLTPAGGAAKNYTFTYVAGTLTVSEYIFTTAPTAATGLVYNGKEQLGVASGSYYTLSGTGRAKNAGTYTVTATPNDGYAWTDGSRTAKSYTWSISKVKLTATYAGGTIYAGANIPTTVTVKGFVNGESASTAAGYKAPKVTITSVQGKTPGRYSFTPTSGSATNYTFSYVAGTLTVYGKASAPSGKTFTYTGATQTGVNAGTGYTLSGTYRASAAGTYTAVASLKSYYKWSDGTASTKKITWRINQASISNAAISAVGNQAYTGSAVTPTPTITCGGVVLSNGSNYTLSYSNNVNAGTATVTATGRGNYTGSVSTTFQIIAPSVTYDTHVQNIAWQDWRSNGEMAGTSGRALRLEGMHIYLSSQPVEGNIEYRTHIQNIAWQDWRANGDMSGTTGRALRLEAIELKLTGRMAELYDIYYRVHAQNLGWMAWAKNGERSGTAGHAWRLEAIQIIIVPKGAAGPGTDFMGIQQNYAATYKQR